MHSVLKSKVQKCRHGWSYHASTAQKRLQDLQAQEPTSGRQNAKYVNHLLAIILALLPVKVIRWAERVVGPLLLVRVTK